jgi:4-hydroxy-tetrahydrodipicolinate reductase
MPPEIVAEEEPRLFAALRRVEERAVAGEEAPGDVAVQLLFDDEGAYLQTVDGKPIATGVISRCRRRPRRRTTAWSCPTRCGRRSRRSCRRRAPIDGADEPAVENSFFLRAVSCIAWACRGDLRGGRTRTMTKVTIVGAAGRMGQALVRCTRQTKELQLVAAVEQASCPLVGKDAGLIAGAGEVGIPISSDLAAGVKAADAVIDFSFHEAVPLTIAQAIAHRKAVVIGTTGLNPDERAAVDRGAAAVPIVWAPNMSLGVNLLFSLVEQTAKALGIEYDVEITEAHHRYKKDAPSGTALRLGEKVAEGRGQVFRDVAIFGREGLGGERPRGQIGIHAVRAADIIGDHTVLFATEGERVEISHRATTRDAFAKGALRAAQWAVGRQPGLYDMQDVLELRLFRYEVRRKSVA